MKILLVEDDRLIGDGLRYGLSKFKYIVDWVTDGKQGYHAINNDNYDAVILDLTLPGMDGLEVLENWRNEGIKVPVLVLTARDAVDQRIQGLKIGADDYLGKPFALNEVAARIEALIRRSQFTNKSILSFGNIELDVNAHGLTLNGKAINLTSKEYKIMYLLMTNRDKQLTRSMIEEQLASEDTDINSNSLDVHIFNLRRKLGNKVIRTIHGVGYTLGNLDDQDTES